VYVFAPPVPPPNYIFPTKGSAAALPKSNNLYSVDTKFEGSYNTELGKTTS